MIGTMNSLFDSSVCSEREGSYSRSNTEVACLLKRTVKIHQLTLKTALIHGGFEIVGQGVQKLECVEIIGTSNTEKLGISRKLASKNINLRLGVAVLGANGQVLGHFARLDRCDANVLESGAELFQVGVVVNLGTVGQTAGPREDRG